VAAKIRQEINILNHVITASSVEFVQLDTTQYSGTVTYSFETVGKVSSGTATVTLRRKGTTTDDATISVTATSYTRQRVTFTPPAGQTEYIINISGGTSPSIQVGRIVVLQSDTTAITSTETQIEIGNFETQSSASTVALANPKYWKYDASKWDGTKSFFVEVVYKRDSSMSSTTWKLQEDGGSDNFSFSDKTTIVSASTATTVTRTRVSFTPTDGRNYRIVSVDSDTMNPSHETYSAKIIVQQTPTVDVQQSSGTTQALLYGGTSGGNEAYSQSFIPSGNVTATGVTLSMLKIDGSPTDNVVVTLRSSHGGASLASGSIPASAIGAATAYYFIPFTSSASLSSGTTYYIEITRSGSRDTSNCIRINYEFNTDNYANGVFEAQTSGSFSALGQDANFKLHTTAPTKIEPQYLLANTGSFGGSTGLKDFDTLYDPAEWSAGGGTITYIHEGNGVASGTGDLKLQSDPNGTPADVTNSTITDCVERERSSSLTMPGASATLDVNVTGTGTLNASRILAQWAFSGSTTTTQTTTGKARIQATTTKTQTGKGDIRKTTTQTTTGKAKVSARTTQTTTGKARIQKTVSQTITGKGDIRKTTTQTTTGKARVQITSSQTQTGKTRVQKRVTQTINGRSRITVTTTRTQTGKSRVTATTTKTETGKARIQKTVSATQTGKARITKTTLQAITGKADIRKTASQTIQGKANIASGQTTSTQTTTGKARIQKTVTQTSTGKARITGTTSRTQQGKARVQKTVSRTQQGLARLQKTTTQTETGKARLQKTATQPTSGKARIQKSVSKNQSGLSRIQKTVAQTETGKARIYKTVTHTITGVASITHTVTTTQAVSGKARIQTPSIRQIIGHARIQKTSSQAIAGHARISVTHSATLTGKALITTRSQKTIRGRAKIRPHLPYQDKYSARSTAHQGKYTPKSTSYTEKYVS
jgi:hypothetical protein